MTTTSSTTTSSTTTTESQSDCPTRKRMTSLRKMVKGARKAMEQRPDKKPVKDKPSSEAVSLAKTCNELSSLKEPGFIRLAPQRTKSGDGNRKSLTQLGGNLPYNMGRDFPHYTAGRNQDDDDEVSLGSVETAIDPVPESRANPGTQSSWGTLGTSAGSGSFSAVPSALQNSENLKNCGTLHNSGNLNSSIAGSSWGTLGASGGSGTFPNFFPTLALGSSVNFHNSVGSFGALDASSAQKSTSQNPVQLNLPAGSWGTLDTSGGALNLKSSVSSGGKYDSSRQASTRSLVSWGNLSIGTPS